MNSEELIAYFQKKGLNLSDKVVKILRDEEFNGAALINATVEILRSVGIPVGPALNIIASIPNN